MRFRENRPCCARVSRVLSLYSLLAKGRRIEAMAAPPGVSSHGRGFLLRCASAASRDGTPGSPSEPGSNFRGYGRRVRLSAGGTSHREESGGGTMKASFLSLAELERTVTPCGPPIWCEAEARL